MAKDKMRLMFAASLTALTVCNAAPALAQTKPEAQAPAAAAGAESDLGAGEIVVTAQKRQESVNKVGMSISALSGDTLTKLGITSAE